MTFVSAACATAWPAVIGLQPFPPAAKNASALAPPTPRGDQGDHCGDRTRWPAIRTAPRREAGRGPSFAHPAQGPSRLRTPVDAWKNLLDEQAAAARGLRRQVRCVSRNVTHRV